MTPEELGSFLGGERSRVEAALAAALDGLHGPAAVLEPIRYALESGGKRLRPILCIAAFRAVNGDAPPAAYRLASSLELIHTYSLIHDDLPSMDDDPVRRGRPATHVRFGVPAATAAGAALIPLAVGTAREAAEALASREVAREVVLRLCRAAGAAGMVGGQLLDLEAEGRRTSIGELEAIHRLKTGALLAAAPVIGAIAAGATAIQRDALTAYGRSVGLAFQVTDDILDVTGTTAVLGKTVGRDTQLEKATFPGLAGVEVARRRAQSEVEAALAALEGVGMRSPELRALARYAVERDR